MRKIQETGRSMVEMLGVLAVIGVLTVAALSGYQKATSKLNMNKTVDATVQILNEWATMQASGLGSVHDFEGPNNYIYKQECKRGYSTIKDVTAQVCQVPLGEIYMKKDEYPNWNSFMLFVTLLDEDMGSCREFLSQDWIRMTPGQMKNGFALHVKSNLGSAVVYAPGMDKPTMTTVSEACETACPQNAQYCTVIFDIAATKRN